MHIEQDRIISMHDDIVNACMAAVTTAAMCRALTTRKQTKAQVTLALATAHHVEAMAKEILTRAKRRLIAIPAEAWDEPLPFDVDPAVIYGPSDDKGPEA